MNETAITLTYLVSGVCFIFALKWMSHPTTARRGVRVGELGMVLAIVATLLKAEIVEFQWILMAAFLGTLVAVPLGLFVPMTAVPQRTALSHAFGALAAGLVGTAEYYLERPHIGKFQMAAIGIEVLLGFLTFTGSLVAFGKLQGLVRDRPWIYRGQNAFNICVLALGAGLVVALVLDPGRAIAFPLLIAVSCVAGLLFVSRIGGADMPTVISLLNSYAGLSAAAMGFVLGNELLIIAGALDGSSGLILSLIMCRAMNRSFRNIIFGGFGAEVSSTRGAEARPVRRVDADETALLLGSAGSVIIVPGYGMAAAQAQHKVRELSDVLLRQGVDVRFAIHPVAGRMPGHMNVLLAEADVPYDQLRDLDQINEEFSQADVVLVVGANDVVNPAARTDPSSPISGMPILNVDQARSVVVVKRSMSSGFAGIDNDLFYLDKTQMLFGDAKQVIGDVVDEIKRQRVTEPAST
ncbi:MAG: NAD(P)(+) transhydrogenase (Re/Si-specific) subunit beta [Actinomycetota bacterium]|nr:NAD(P)(+) transhydrogenase (Re/Si-specific) subunit beta [Actinomycetota bacterium]